MHRERLTRLITILEAVPPSQFDICIWKGTNECGTAACALGWAAMDLEFNRQGLHLEQNPCIDDEFFIAPVFESVSCIDAGAGFFDLSWEDSKKLFLPSSYPRCQATPQDVTDRIKALLEQPL